MLTSFGITVLPVYTSYGLAPAENTNFVAPLAISCAVSLAKLPISAHCLETGWFLNLSPACWICWLANACLFLILSKTVGSSKTLCLLKGSLFIWRGSFGFGIGFGLMSCAKSDTCSCGVLTFWDSCFFLNKSSTLRASASDCVVFWSWAAYSGSCFKLSNNCFKLIILLFCIIRWHIK